MEKYIFTGKSEEESLDIALNDLNTQKSDIIYHVVEEQKGGLFKTKKVNIEVIKKDEINDFIKDYILELTNNLGFDVKLESKMRDDILNVTLYSDNNNLLIGKDGRNMSALTTLIRQVVYNEIGQFYKFNLDVGEYKLKQQKNIERLALKVAREVGKSKVEAKLDPMNSYNRRIVHNVLNDNRYVYTESYGEEPNRYVVIKPRNDK